MKKQLIEFVENLISGKQRKKWDTLSPKYRQIDRQIDRKIDRQREMDRIKTHTAIQTKSFIIRGFCEYIL